MTTITLELEQKVNFSKTHFYDLEELSNLLYEELLEQKMQKAKKEWIFIDY